MTALEVRARRLYSSCLTVKLAGFRKYPQRGRQRKTALCLKNEQVDGHRHEIARGAYAVDLQRRKSLMAGVPGRHEARRNSLSNPQLVAEYRQSVQPVCF